jgi:hypothetical protein
MIGGQVNTNAFRRISIASTYNTNIFTGDAVLLVDAGTIEKDTGTSTMTPVGIFMGCEYTDPNLGYLLHKQYWPADTVATDAFAYVYDDPDALFHIQADGQVPQTALGANIGVTQTAGSTAFGQSRVDADIATIAITATLPLRIVDFVIGPDSAVNDAFTDIIVKWNFGMHQYETATGVGT